MAAATEQATQQGYTDEMIARKVSEGIAAALPAVIQQMMATQAQEGSFAPGMGPSSQVLMSIGGDAKPKPLAKNYLKHYRLDGAINGKHQLLDVTQLDERGQLKFERTADGKINVPAVQKGEYIEFVNGEFYATTEMQVAFIEHKMKSDPFCRIYEDVGGSVVPCGSCGMYFANEEGLTAHMKATHGVGR